MGGITLITEKITYTQANFSNHKNIEIVRVNKILADKRLLTFN